MTYSVGIIGTGFVAGMHAQAYETLNDVTLEAICDVQDDSLREFGETWAVPTEGRYLGHEEMLADIDLDIVSVTTPSLFHRDHVIAAARAGANIIWCEKPIALSVSDAEEMVDVCDLHDTELVINHTRRFSSPFRELRTLLKEEKRIGSIETVIFRSARELIRNGTHSVDLLQYVLGSRVEQVAGYLTGSHGMRDSIVDSIDGSYDDSGGGGTLIMDDGTYVTIDHTSPRPTASTLYDFIGTEGRLAIEGSNWRFWELKESEWEYSTPHEPGNLDHIKSELPRSIQTDGVDDMFENAASHLVELLEGNVQNRSPGDEASKVLEILVAMFVSHYTGSWIKLPLEQPLREVEITSW